MPEERGEQSEPEDRNERLRRRMREADEQRAERVRRWAAGEYPAAAYEAHEALLQVVPPPREYADSWDAHVAQLICDALAGGAPDDAAALIARLRPLLDADAQAPTKLRTTLRALSGGRVSDMVAHNQRIGDLFKQSDVFAQQRRIADLFRQSDVFAQQRRIADLLKQSDVFAQQRRITDLFKQPNVFAQNRGVLEMLTKRPLLERLYERPFDAIRPASYVGVVRATISATVHPVDFAQAARTLAPVAEQVATSYVEASPEHQDAVIAEAEAAGPEVVATLGRIAIAQERQAAAAERSAAAHERMAVAAENPPRPHLSPWELLIRSLLLLGALADLVQIFGVEAVREALETLLDLLSQRPPGPGPY